MANYQTLQPNENNPFSGQNPNRTMDEEANQEDSDNDDASHNIMIHTAETKARSEWNHIVDLDSFFRRTYRYHQKHGFWVMFLQEILELFQFAMVVAFIVFVVHCINYPVMFRDVKLNNSTTDEKIRLNDVLYSSSQCHERFTYWTYALIVISVIFWMIRVVTIFFHIIQYWDIKQFYNIALKIDDSELENFTWHEIQRRIREVQSEQQLCIHKEQLTELDIYHRILRFKNYMVSMMNKSLIQSKIRLPFIGEVVCLSKGLIFNIELILFRGPFSPFENNWHLKEEFKRSNKRNELASQLSKQIMWVALANAIMSPLIFLWQLIYFFFSYAPVLRKDPNLLGTRCWSQFGMLYLRHFNELDHELEARLNRAYRPAVKYMNSFSSPLMAVIAQNCIFTFGGFGMFLALLTVYDEDVLQVEHLLSLITILLCIALASHSFIPDENMIWCPEQLIRNILAHVHYLPAHWRGIAHSTKVRNEFEDFFQLKLNYLLNEIFSPFVTPFVLMFSLRPRSQEIVDFFRNFTVSVIGVGDVCSFAQMEIRKHGNPDWQITNSAEELASPSVETNQYTQGENGKTELSLIHFALTNPHWKMPTEAKQFVRGIKKHAIQDLNKARTNGGTVFNNLGGTAMGQSLMSMGSLGEEYSSVVQSILQIQNLSTSQHLSMSMYQQNNYNYTQPPAPQSQSPPQSQSSNAHTFDFERILQQNLSDGSMSTPLRSQFLPNINEDEDSPSDEHFPQPVPNRSSVGNMNKSIRGNLNRLEGPMDVSRNGLIYSLCNIPQSETLFSPEFTQADMCLSTLYLHELHHKQQTRRGVRLEASQRQLWQTPHHNQPQPTASSFSQERTPLLTKKT